MKSWAHFLGGSITVYLLMAACSAGSHRNTWEQGNKATGGRGGSSSQATGGNANGGEVLANAGASAPNGSSGDEGTTGGTIADMVGDMMDPVPDADAAPTVSGSRLKAKYIAGEDGSRQFNYAWRDTKRNEDCNFAHMADGKLRCLPTSGASQIYFADEACSTPLWVRVKASGCGASQPNGTVYGMTNDTAGCVATIQRLTVAHPSTIYSGTSAQCIAAAAPDVFEYFTSSGTPIALTEFVAATEEVE